MTPLVLPESWRMLRHPAVLAGLVLTAVLLLSDDFSLPRDSVDAVVSTPIFFLGPLTFFAANLLATRDRRAGTDEVLRSLPVGAADRTRALCLAVAAPAVVACVVSVVLRAVLQAAGSFAETPSLAMAAQVPLTVLGAGLLGVLVGRWFPHVIAAFAVLVAMVALNVVTSTHAETWQTLGTYVAWARYSMASDAWAGWYPGSPGWHALYLLGLDLLALAGALAPVVRRRAPLVAGAVAAGGLTVLAACLQLP